MSDKIIEISSRPKNTLLSTVEIVETQPRKDGILRRATSVLGGAAMRAMQYLGLNERADTYKRPHGDNNPDQERIARLGLTDYVAECEQDAKDMLAEIDALDEAWAKRRS